jgi:DNA-binding NtrC family response regulator
MIRIALYSGDRTLQPLLSSALGKDFQIRLESEEQALDAMIGSGSCDALILDLDSRQGSLKDRISCSERLIASGMPAIVMADDGMRSTAMELVRQGAFGYCRKPPSIRDLKTMLNRIAETASLKRELQARQQMLEASATCDQLIGSSPQMREVYDLVRRVANLNASVLVTGESGTGKELIARAIHNLGGRSSKPFVAVCCGAIPETLIEAELFGHEKGAFTGTVGAREGYLEQAGDGTLFLDEIGELSLSTQVKLLRVLQQREFCRLGSNRLVPLRARLVFATHRDLSELVAQGKFRQDLYYRIHVMRIESPALQEHPEDIRLLATHFLHQYSEMYEKTMVDIEPDAMAMLNSYSWPGNVRELENVIQRAIIVASDDHIRVCDLPQNIRAENVLCIDEYHPLGSFEEQVYDYKVKLAMNAVRENNGNKTLAARSLQISRAYLHRLIRIAEPGMLIDPPVAHSPAGHNLDARNREVGVM